MNCSDFLSFARHSVSSTVEQMKKSKLVKVLASSFITGMIACLACVTCFATDPEPSATITDMSSTLVSAFGSLSTTLQGYIAAVLPIGIGIMGTIFGIRFGINFFMSLTHREH